MADSQIKLHLLPLSFLFPISDSHLRWSKHNVFTNHWNSYKNNFHSTVTLKLTVYIFWRDKLNYTVFPNWGTGVITFFTHLYIHVMLIIYEGCSVRKIWGCATLVFTTLTLMCNILWADKPSISPHNCHGDWDICPSDTATTKGNKIRVHGEEIRA